MQVSEPLQRCLKQYKLLPLMLYLQKPVHGNGLCINLLFSLGFQPTDVHINQINTK